MSLIRDTVANFIGGVSQQPDKLMYPNQSKRIINYLLSPSIGLKDRPPTENIGRLMDSLGTVHPLCHTIIKEDEEYEVIIDNVGNIKVFDLTGVEKTVHYGEYIYEVVHNDTKCYTDVKGANNTTVSNDTTLYTDYTLATEYTLAEGEAKSDFTYNGVNEAAEIKTALKTYLTTTSPLKNLIATTIADYTFILNKTVTTALMDELYTNPYGSSALIFVRQGNYTTDHIIKVNGSQVASYTSTGDLATTKTNTIAQNLYNNLVTNLGTTDWNITVSGSVICLQKKDGSDFTISSEDSNANNDLYAFYKKADALNILPTVAPNGYILEIVGENTNKDDDYYVQFETADGSNFGNGSWKECCSPNIKYRLDASTMPHALVRQEDGTFNFNTIDWTDRGAGDEDSAPSPSFIGNTIQDVFTHKGRLAFLSVDKSIYSDTQDIFSFFKKTTTAELDTDPIDVGSNSKMVLLKHNLPFNEELLLFSETSAFSIKGGDVFSNSTVAIDLTFEYPCSRFVKPINAGGTGFFLFENGDYSRVMELFITSTYAIDARDVTEQVPSYLPKNMYKIAGSTANSLACFLSTDETNAIYVYNYYYSSEQKAQSAWSKWVFDNAKILNVDFHDNWMYLVVQYADGVYLEKMNFTPQNKEPNLDYLFYLDRKFKATGTHSEGYTTFNLPYAVAEADRGRFKAVDSKGFPLEVTFETSSSVKIEGNVSTETITFGFTFRSEWELPVIYYRQQTQNGTKVVEGILMLRDINLSYADSGYFKVNVASHYTTTTTSDFQFGTFKQISEAEGDDYDFEFTGITAGTVSATIGELNVSSGTFLIPVLYKNEEVDITIINDGYMPSCFLSMEWIGDFVIRGQ